MPTTRLCLALCAVLGASSAQALDWSSTAVSWRYGTQFAEPFNGQDIHKHILALTHADGYQYGSNYLNLDLLFSDKNDARSLGSDSGAREAYLVYRHTLDLGKLAGHKLDLAGARGLGLTAGFDWNSKSDVGYNSRKRMLVLGPTLMWEVPGFLNTSLLYLHESNAPSGPFAPISQVRGRYTYKGHAMFNVVWGIPVGGASWEGYANFIGSKGRDETGAPTGAEQNIDMALMWDMGRQWRAGVGYQYWRNKFGNTAVTTGGKGYRASTPMVRVEFKL
ncbi:outer envelope protein [Massilia sp. TS11]|uniref:outer envelope protein n=1 Tax=Massilia sp. TS11 TaxID=2908003 RepID=UPI001EDA0F79|nr:outer envelope protein [Massilia sp. TS11]MCG2585269.1 outer envelope protein [Massilia sp. TS11]